MSKVKYYDRIRRSMVVISAAICLAGLVACTSEVASSNGVVNHLPSSARANQYAAALRSSSVAGSTSREQICEVHLIDVRQSFDQDGNERLRSYFVLTNYRGIFVSADTCGLSVADCVAVIAKRSSSECRLPPKD
ncbi:hypothetical protein D3C81_904820 [compost metagenome]